MSRSRRRGLLQTSVDTSISRSKVTHTSSILCQSVTAVQFSLYRPFSPGPNEPYLCGLYNAWDLYARKC